MTSFPASFFNRAITHPDRILFYLAEQARETSVTNQQLLFGARRFAALYLDQDAHVGDVLLISLKPGPDLYYAFLGALLIGCIPSMMPFPSVKQHPDIFWKSHDALFRHLGGGIIVTFDQNVTAIRTNIDDGLMTVLTPEQAIGFYDGPIYAWHNDEVCCLQHSSGTTGLKKGVTLKSHAITLQIEGYGRAINLDPTDVIVSWLPLYHDMGFVTTLLLPLVTGNPVVVMSPFEWLARPLALFDMIERHNARYVWLPNFAFNHLVRSAEQSSQRSLSSIKAFINCSEPCKADSFKMFLERFESWGVRADQLQICYAMAETVFAITQTPMGTPPKSIRMSKSALMGEPMHTPFENEGVEILSVGVPIDGINVQIDGIHIGEVMVSGQLVFDGYYKKDSREAFTDGWYRTGDMGFIADGELYLLGRKKDLIIVLGKNFFAHDIEMLVGKIQGIKAGRVIALGVFNPDVGSEDVVVIAEAEASHATSSLILRGEIKRVLEDQIGLNPRKALVVELGWLIKTTSGKISRHENMSKYLSTLQ